MNKKFIWTILVGGIIGCPYFFLSYNNLELLGTSVYLIFGVGSIVGSFLLMLFLSEQPIKVSLLLAAGAELSIVTSIFLDISKNDSSHNLFPFEVFLTFTVIFAAAVVGAFLAQLVNQTKRSIV